MTHDEAKQTTSRLLKRAMDGAGLNAEAVSEMSGGVGARHVRRFRNGHRLPHIDRLDQLLRVCGYELTIGIRKVEPDDDQDDS